MLTLLITAIVLFVVKFSWSICAVINLVCVVLVGSKHPTPIGFRLLFSILFGPFYTYFAIKALRSPV